MADFDPNDPPTARWRDLPRIGERVDAVYMGVLVRGIVTNVDDHGEPRRRERTVHLLLEPPARIHGSVRDLVLLEAVVDTNPRQPWERGNPVIWPGGEGKWASYVIGPPDKKRGHRNPEGSMKGRRERELRRAALRIQNALDNGEHPSLEDLDLFPKCKGCGGRIWGCPYDGLPTSDRDFCAYGHNVPMYYERRSYGAWGQPRQRAAKYPNRRKRPWLPNPRARTAQEVAALKEHAARARNYTFRQSQDHWTQSAVSGDMGEREFFDTGHLLDERWRRAGRFQDAVKKHYGNPLAGARTAYRTGMRVEYVQSPWEVAYRSTMRGHDLARHPRAGERGTVTTMYIPGAGSRSYLPGPGGGLVYVDWDRTGVMGVPPSALMRIAKRR